MKAFDIHSAFTSLCRLSEQWGVMLVFDEDFMATFDPETRTFPAAPWLDMDADHAWQGVADNRLFVLFDTEADMEHAYCLTVGDDGPTELNPYDGIGRVYALTCDPTGQMMNENT